MVDNYHVPALSQDAINWVTWMLNTRPDLDTLQKMQRELKTVAGLHPTRTKAVLAWLDQGGWITLDSVGGDLYIDSRSREGFGSHWPPNRWADLKTVVGEDIYRAHAMWETVDGLTRAGWKVETSPARVYSHLGVTSSQPPYAIMIRGLPAPVIHYPQRVSVKMHIENLWQAGASRQILVCHERDLEDIEGEVREYIFDRQSPAPLDIFLLPAPGYQPIWMSGALRSVEGGTQHLVQDLQYQPPQNGHTQEGPPSDWTFQG